MRNLKRALSLTLASVMLLGMMVVGSNAAAGYDDVKETDNVEAIEVLQAVEVMVGDERGFGPDRPVNRAEMAVVMAKLLNLDYNYYASTCPFTDVSGNYDWARGWVGACAANGIVSGRGNGIYDPGATVTAVEAASMMMRALGYFQYTEDYAAGFVTATVRQGSEIGIFNGVGTDGTTPMTRNQVAQMALNALESEMVTFTGTPGVNINGVNVSYRAEYTPRTSTELKYRAIEDRTSDASLDSNHRGQYYIQLGEELYDGKLTKKFDRDEFERPSINWQYDGKEIGVYVDYDLKKAEYTDGVKGSELYDLLTYTTINDYDLLGFVDGVDSGLKKAELVRSNKNKVNASNTGVLTEVFVDQFRDEITVTSINTWLAQANSDYNTSSDSVSLKVYTGSSYDSAKKTKSVSSPTKIVDGAEVPEAEDVKKDDYRLVYMSGKEDPNYEVVRMYDVEILNDTAISKWEHSTSKVCGDFTAAGTAYKTNVKAFYDGGNVLESYDAQLLTDMSYNIYLDRYGNAIGVDLYEGAKNYVFIAGYDRLGSNISVRTADAAAIFLDGTMDVITVNVTDTNKYIEKSTNGQFEKWQNWDADEYGWNGRRSENRWYTYTVSNNGVYTLKPVERFFWTDYDLAEKESKILNTANLFVDDSRPNSTVKPVYTNQGRIYGNDDSVYITVDVDTVDTSTSTQDKHTYVNAITDVNGVYTGAQNVKLELTADTKHDLGEMGENNDAYVYSIYDSNYYIIASVVLGDAQGAVANYAYILSDAKNERVEFEGSSRADGDATYYWEFDAVVNGEVVTLTAKSKYSSVFSGLEAFHVQELRYDGEYVTKIVDVKPGKVMTENDIAETDDMDVYDVGHVAAVDAYGKKTDTGNETISHADRYALSSHRLNGTIELVGRTLYTERERNGSNTHDVGLALTSDAKAVLVQYENGDREKISCGSVSEAVGRLADADKDAPGTQFQGRIVAVLNSAGAAEWVVIISDTELRTNDPGYGSGKYTLDLFGDLANTNYIYPTTVTATRNNVSTIITGTPIYSRNSDGTDLYGAGTRYQIPAGSLVTIQDYDIRDGKVIASDLVSGVISDGYNDRITRNDRNNTLTIDKMDRSVVIVTDNNPFIKTEADITVTGDGRNDVRVVAADDVYVNDTFVLEIIAEGKDADDYDITVNGAVLVSEGTYRITAKNVIVNVVKKTVTPDVEYTLAIADEAKGHCSVTINGNAAAIGDKVTKADTVVVNPAKAVEIVFDDTTKTATVQPKEGFSFNPDWNCWVGLIGDDIALVPFAGTATVAGTFATRFSIARDADSGLGDGQQETKGWVTKMIADFASGNPGTWSVKNAAGKVIWVAEQDDGAILLKKAEGVTKDEVNKAFLDLKNCTIWRTSEDTPVEPSEVDARTLPVQADTTGGDGAPVTFKIYFGNGNDTRKVTAEDIAKALAANNHETVTVDIENHTATLKGGARVYWQNTQIDDKNIAHKGVRGVTETYKIDVLGTAYYLTPDTYTDIPVSDSSVKSIMLDSWGYSSNKVESGVNVVFDVKDGKVNNLVVAAPVGTANGDKTYVEAYQAKSNVAIAAAATAITVNDKAGTHKVSYGVDVKSADGMIWDAAGMVAIAANTAFYVQKGAEFSFKPSAVNAGSDASQVGQVVTVKVNGEVKDTKTVSAVGESPALGKIVIPAPVETDDKDTDGFVTLKFELSDIPAPETTGKHVFLNDKEIEDVTVTSTGGVEKRVYKLNNIEDGMVILLQKTAKSALTTTTGTVTMPAANTGNKEGTYVWNDADASPASADEDKNVYLYTTWPINMNYTGSVWKAFKTISKFGDVSDEMTALNGTSADKMTHYFKTEAPEKERTIYIQAQDPGSQLWFVKNSVGSTENIKPFQVMKDGKLVDIDGAGASVALPNGSLQKGVWSLVVDQPMNNTNVAAAYTVDTSDGNETAEYPNGTTFEWGKEVKITVKLEGQDAFTNKWVESVVFRKGNTDTNTWKYEMRSDGVYVWIEDDRAPGDRDIDSASALVGATLDVTFVGGYQVHYTITSA